MPARPGNEAKHGTQSRYSHGLMGAPGCRCDPCRTAHALALRAPNRAQQARYLSRGLDASGRPRKQPYSAAALRLLVEHGLDPDPRFVS